MRPHIHDRDHNRKVGKAFGRLVEDLIREGHTEIEINETIGEHVNAIARESYNLGQREVYPSAN